jgi:hypothetical protein
LKINCIFTNGIYKNNRPATLNDGILLTKKKKKWRKNMPIFFDQKKDQISVTKFVPASGAAS